MAHTHREFRTEDIPLAYLISFRAYGTWLHGDRRGSVDRFHKSTPEHQPTTLRTEAVAGITTFFTMAYIVVVNPSILSTSGPDPPHVFDYPGNTLGFYLARRALPPGREAQRYSSGHVCVSFDLIGLLLLGHVRFS